MSQVCILLSTIPSMTSWTLDGAMDTSSPRTATLGRDEDLTRNGFHGWSMVHKLPEMRCNYYHYI